MITSKHKECGRGHKTPLQGRIIRRGKWYLDLKIDRQLASGANELANFGGEFHESKVAGFLASASGSVHRLDRILLCDFDGISLFIRLQWVKQLDVYLQRVLVEGSTTNHVIEESLGGIDND